jgi:DNA polymerase III delta prime subunit
MKLTPKLNEALWVERYRPTTIAECVLSDELNATFSAMVSGGVEISNMIFAGTAGLGKTTVARALCEMLGIEYMLINGSEESGIDVLRNKIRQFASTVSMSGSDEPKVVILDEADYLNPQSTQPAMRGFIEEFSSNCRFIFTCNHKHKIIDALHSRCPVIEFNTPRIELPTLAMKFMNRMEAILTAEGIKYEKNVLANLIVTHAPDWRRVIGECQRHSTSGELNPVALIGMSDQSIAELVKYLKGKDFKAMRSWVVNNIGMDATAVFRKLYDSLSDTANPQSIPAAVLILAEYSYKLAFVADRELCVVACLTELMGSVEWKAGR